MKKLALIKTPFPKFAHKKTVLSKEEVISRSIKFFSDNGWMVREKSANGVTFKGRPPMSLRLLFLTMFGFHAVVKRATRFQSILIRVKPSGAGNSLTIIHGKATGKLINKFQNFLPPTLTMK